MNAKITYEFKDYGNGGVLMEVITPDFGTASSRVIASFSNPDSFLSIQMHFLECKSDVIKVTWDAEQIYKLAKEVAG